MLLSVERKEVVMALLLGAPQSHISVGGRGQAATITYKMFYIELLSITKPENC